MVCVYTVNILAAYKRSYKARWTPNVPYKPFPAEEKNRGENKNLGYFSA